MCYQLFRAYRVVYGLLPQRVVEDSSIGASLKVLSSLPIPEAHTSTARPMSTGLIDSINRRTQLAGYNRLALLLFRLGGSQLFGVNAVSYTHLTLPTIYSV